MVRGRRPNGTLPETKALKQQREFRAKRAEKLAELEASNRALEEENRQLKLENQLLRDHMMSAETASSLATNQHQNASFRDESEVRRRLGVIQDVQGQLDIALQRLRSVTADGGTSISHTPPSIIAKGQTSHIDQPAVDHRRGRPLPTMQAFDTHSSLPNQNTVHYPQAYPTPPGSGSTGTRCESQASCSRRDDSTSTKGVPGRTPVGEPSGWNAEAEDLELRRDQAANDGLLSAHSRYEEDGRYYSDLRMVPDIEKEQCCLGVVQCDEQGNII